MWANALERAGVQVVYGFIDWKTHAKVSVVVRREEKGFRTYCHFGTGNYHPVSARVYTDLSYFTADQKIGRDAAKLFNYITGYLEPKNLRQLVISPQGMRAELLRLLDVEIAAAKAGKPSGLWAKMNALVDPMIIDKLYEASSAGVPIDLVVRGICCLRPGIPGHERDHLRQIDRRPLPRACAMLVLRQRRDAAAPTAKVYISSADWMPRNFDRRIEYMLPIDNPTVHAQLLDQVMVANLIDNEQSWRLNSDGTYTRLQPKAGARVQPARIFHVQPVAVGPRPGAQERPQSPQVAVQPRAIDPGQSIRAVCDHRHRVELGPAGRLCRIAAHTRADLQREIACRPGDGPRADRQIIARGAGQGARRASPVQAADRPHEGQARARARDRRDPRRQGRRRIRPPGRPHRLRLRGAERGGGSAACRRRRAFGDPRCRRDRRRPRRRQPRACRRQERPGLARHFVAAGRASPERKRQRRARRARRAAGGAQEIGPARARQRPRLLHGRRVVARAGEDRHVRDRLPAADHARISHRPGPCPRAQANGGFARAQMVEGRGSGPPRERAGGRDDARPSRARARSGRDRRVDLRHSRGTALFGIEAGRAADRSVDRGGARGRRGRTSLRPARRPARRLDRAAVRRYRRDAPASPRLLPSGRRRMAGQPRLSGRPRESKWRSTAIGSRSSPPAG